MTKTSGWVIEIRKTCLICGEPIKENRFRSYCSTQCRNKRNNNKRTESGYSREYQRWQSGKYADNKLQCLMCHKWYIQVGSHVKQVHKLTAREYREEYELPLKRGVVPIWYRTLKGNQALDNGTYKNLEKGAVKRFKKNDPRAKKISGQKGLYGSKGFPKTEFYE